MPQVRILAGSAHGRTLRVPTSARPTAARIRKSLFDLLAHAVPDAARFLDLYAGAGTVGLEAASRGYDATLIENNPRAVATLETNRRELGLDARIVRMDARRALTDPPGEFDVVFIDPPYAHDLPRLASEALASRGLVASGGMLIVQGPARLSLPAEAVGFDTERRVYGTNALTLYRRRPDHGQSALVRRAPRSTEGLALAAKANAGDAGGAGRTRSPRPRRR